MSWLLLKNFCHGPLTEPAPPADEAALAELAARVSSAARARLGRTLSIREVDAGSCNGCELEIHALNNVLYDLERFGLRFVASPRHADVLLVTGPVTTNMREALERTYRATPDPKWVVAASPGAARPPRPSGRRRRRSQAWRDRSRAARRAGAAGNTPSTPQSTRAPESLTTLPSRAASAAIRAANSSGVRLVVTSSPVSRIFLLTSG